MKTETTICRINKKLFEEAESTLEKHGVDIEKAVNFFLGRVAALERIPMIGNRYTAEWHLPDIPEEMEDNKMVLSAIPSDEAPLYEDLIDAVDAEVRVSPREGYLMLSAAFLEYIGNPEYICMFSNTDEHRFFIKAAATPEEERGSFKVNVVDGYLRIDSRLILSRFYEIAGYLEEDCSYVMNGATIPELNAVEFDLFGMYMASLKQ